MTWYLKYRPQTIAELDVAAVREALTNILKSGKLPHAFLFCGPRGTGKTSSARILAKAVNCEGKGSKPCNKCATCIAITAGSNVDVVEMDAASNRGIDDARALKENIKLAPIASKYKVYIIDEAHMLTTEAANALLKTLEEPPEHAMFVLCTTEPTKLPKTVVSRCTQINFNKPSVAEAVESLRRVVDAEGLKADDQALKLVVRAATGGLRDGRKILEQVYLEQGELSEAAVRKTTGFLESADPGAFVDLLIAGAPGPALGFVTTLVREGVGLRGFMERTVEELRERLMADLSHKEKWLALIDKLQWAYIQSRESAVEQLPLEIAVIELCSTKIDSYQLPVVNEVEVVKVVNADKPNLKLGDLVGKWNDILKEVKPQNHSVEGLLRSTRPVDFDGHTLKIEVFYKFHKDKLETERCRQIVEAAVAKIMKSPKIKLVLTLGKKQEGEVGGQVGEDIIAAAENIFKIQAV